MKTYQPLEIVGYQHDYDSIRYVFPSAAIFYLL